MRFKYKIRYTYVRSKNYPDPREKNSYMQMSQCRVVLKMKFLRRATCQNFNFEPVQQHVTRSSETRDITCNLFERKMNRVYHAVALHKNFRDNFAWLP